MYNNPTGIAKRTQVIIGAILVLVIIILAWFVFGSPLNTITSFFKNQTDRQKIDEFNKNPARAQGFKPNIPDLDKCTAAKEDNPLLLSVIKTPFKTVLYVLNGNVNKFSYNSSGNSQIQIISPNGSQVQDLELRNEEGIVFAKDSKTEKSINSIKIGHSVLVSYECSPDTPSNSRITQLVIKDL